MTKKVVKMNERSGRVLFYDPVLLSADISEKKQKDYIKQYMNG